MDGDAIIKHAVPSGILTGIKFDLMTGGDIEKLSNVNIVEANDLTNAKLGLPNAFRQCATCGSKDIRDCDGHFGVLKFPESIYHPHFLSEVIQILNQICPGCKSVKQDVQMKGCSNLETEDTDAGEDAFDLSALYKDLNALQKKFLKFVNLKFSLPKGVLARVISKKHFKLKKANVKHFGIRDKRASMGKQAGCKYCTRNGTEWYPAMKFKILSRDVQGKKCCLVVADVNEKLPKELQHKCLSDVLPKDYWNFVPTSPQPEGLCLDRLIMSPSQVFSLLKQVDPEYIKQFVTRRELLFLSCLPVTPNCHRVMEAPNADGPLMFFDERTAALKRVVDLSRKLGEFRQHPECRALASSYVTSRVSDCVKLSKLRSNCSLSGGPPSIKSKSKFLKEVVFGKRTDNSFRMVVVGDPKIRLGEIGLPVDVAETMYIGEHVNDYNSKKLSICCNLQLIMKDKFHVRRKGELIALRKANKLQVGDMFYRPLEDGDIVLINRPPSVHQHSIIALSVKVLPTHSVTSINPLCCAPLAGDFDGDCLHGYFPQSVNTRVELGELVSLDSQLLNGQDGRSLVSLTHDSLTAAYLLTLGDSFLNKFEIQQLAMLSSLQLPFPAIFKASPCQTPLWTGRQVFSMFLPLSPDADKGFERHISENEILSSPQLSLWLQDSTSSLFSSLFKSFGKKALDYLYSAQDTLCEWISMRGFSVSLSDIYLSPDSYTRKKMIDEIDCGLKEAEDAIHYKELIVDPQMVFLLKSHGESGIPSHPMSHGSLPWKPTHLSKASVFGFRSLFYELQDVVHQYAENDNSMLAMIHAGSKGNLLKLVQQSACIGLQLTTSSLPFKMPRQLSCVAWNHLKASNCYGIHHDSEESCGGQNFAVIRASFLDSLNPLECLVHASSGRSGLFKENAEIPGTLTRKLMFYMRDLYCAYDGTVRSAYGHQVVRFSYIEPEDTHPKNVGSCELFDRESVEGKGLGGEPVGLWAACALSEAAYGAAEGPVNSLEDSPLMLLKNALECGQQRKNMDRTISLVLSKNLRRWPYGSEYGALEVKNHLDRVLFSDLVTDVMIMYCRDHSHASKFSPWVSHFHVSKGRVVSKGLTIAHIVDELIASYDSVRKKVISLPPLSIQSEGCSLCDMKEEHNEHVCIAMSVEAANSPALLDTIRDVVTNVLLQTLIKGFLEFKVDIVWGAQLDSQGELFLKITMSDNCVPRKFWSTLVNACMPIWDLIDWERSHPDNVYDICNLYGIDVAWQYFLGALKSATSCTGRRIRQEHLRTVADCLSVTGEFHGLSAKGRKLQSEQTHVSTSFSQACFSNPFKGFIDAAKQGSTDHLYGIIDAVAWGKEAPIGTGGHFELLSSLKVCDPAKTESIYETLYNLDGDKSCDPIGVSKFSCEDRTEKSNVQQMVAEADNGASCLGNKYRTRVKHRYKELHVDQEKLVKGYSKFGYSSKHKGLTSLETNLKYISCSIGSWTDLVDMSSSLQRILHKYPLNESLNDEDKLAVMEALNFHPRRDVKLRSGLQDLKVGHHPSHQGTRCFILVRNDGTTEDFSYRKCVIGAANHISPDFGSTVAEKLNRQRFMSKALSSYDYMSGCT